MSSLRCIVMALTFKWAIDRGAVVLFDRGAVVLDFWPRVRVMYRAWVPALKRLATSKTTAKTAIQTTAKTTL